MKDYKYHLSITDCRAIKSAEIDLSEITVLTGVNASGKSTIARMFRDLVEMSSEYERLLAAQTWQSRMDLWRYAVLSGRPKSSLGAAFSRRGVRSQLSKGELTLADAVSMLGQVLEEELGAAGEGDNSLVAQRARRILDIRLDNGSLLDVFHKEAESTLAKFEKRRASRSYVAYRDLMLSNPLFEGVVDFTEGGHTVFSNTAKKDTLDAVTFIKRAIYIESPFKSIPSAISSTELNMGDSFTRIKEDVPLALNAQIPELAAVLSGKIEFEKYVEDDGGLSALFGRNGRWVYERQDGARFELEECATGIKALSVLDILYSNGWLDPETLLIIDEPEAHLHPQWVVEYARILLLLAKRLKVRMVITTHSPDMVHALRDFSANEDFGSNTCFYLAKEDKESGGQYNYEKLGMNIGPIFTVFNQAKDRISSIAKNIREGAGE